MDDLEEFLRQVKANLRASKKTELKKSSGGSSRGTPRGESRHLPANTAAGEDETDRVAGKNTVGAIIGGGPPENDGASESGDSPSTKQLRLRLPHGFVKALQRLQESPAADVFSITVFGALGNVYAPVEFFAAYKELQRIGMVLRQSLETGLSDELLSRVKGAIKMIDQVCRARRVGYASMRMRLPRDYTDALLMLSASEREMIIRLAVSAVKVSFCMSSLVLKAHVLRDLGERLMAKMASEAPGPPESEIRELLDVISGLHMKTVEGGRP